MASYKLSEHPLVDKINRSRLHEFMTQALPHLAIGMVTCLLMLWLFYDNTTMTTRSVWIALISFLAAMTIIFYSVYFLAPNKISLKTWSVVIFLVALIWGLVLASIDYLLLNGAPLHEKIFYALIMTSIVSVTAPAMAYYIWAYIAMITPIVIQVFLMTYHLDINISKLILGFIPFSYVSILLFAFNLRASLLNLIVLTIENEQANNAKTNVIAMASHDIRQPLQAMSLTVDELQHDPDLHHHPAVNRLEASVDNMQNLLNDLLDVSKLDTGNVPINNQHVLASTVMAPIIHDAASLCEGKGLRLHTDISALTLYVDPSQFSRVVMNFISNAVRYTHEGSITIKLYQTDTTSVCLEVSDTGIGIDEQEQNNVFSEFYQLNNPERNQSKGLGLGLAIVARLCKLQGWDVGLDSTIGEGSRFYITCPLGDAGQIAPSPQGDQLSTDMDGIRVLVIDDQEEILHALDELLTRWQVVHMCASSWEDAQALAAQKAFIPTLALLDYRLTDQTGVEVFEQLKEHWTDSIQAIFITAEQDETALNNIKHSGQILLTKPVKPAQLRRAIHLTQDTSNNE